MKFGQNVCVNQMSDSWNLGHVGSKKTQYIDPL